MDLKRNLKKEFARYVMLSVFAMIGMSCYILGDTYFVSKATGVNGLAALNLAIPPYSLMQALGMMCGVGGATRFSLAGGKRDKETENIFTQTIYFGAGIAIIFIIIAIFFMAPLTKVLGADSETQQLTIDYLRPILLAAPLFVLNDVLNAFVRNDKNPNLAMAAMIAGSLGNVVLDYLFMFPLHMGIFGAAVATAMSPGIGILVLSAHIIRKKNNFKLRLQPFNIKKCFENLQPGLSSFVTEFSNAVVILVFNMLMLKLIGNIGVTAYGIVANVALVVTAVLNGISQGMQPIISKAYGKGDTVTVHTIYKWGVSLGILFSIVMYITAVLFSSQLVTAFNSEGNEQLFEIARNGVILYFTGFIGAAVNIITAAFFAAIGDGMRSFAIGVLRALVVSMPVAAIMSALMRENGLWMSFLVTELIVLIVSVVMYRKHKKN